MESLLLVGGRSTMLSLVSSKQGFYKNNSTEETLLLVSQSG